MSEETSDHQWSFQLHVGFRNGRFVAYLRDPVQTSPANLYHRLNSSGSGALRFTYEPQQAAQWAREYPVAAMAVDKLSWVGKRSEQLGLKRQFWLFQVDDERQFSPLNDGHPWPADSAEQAVAAYLEANPVEEPERVLAQEADPTAKSLEQDFT